MLVGDSFVYQVSWIDDAILLLLLALPILLFIGYFLAKILYKDREYAEPTDVVVMPHDLTWLNYTNNIRVIREISLAVIRLQQQPPVSYYQIMPYLKTDEAREVAMLIDTFHVYREQDIREYMAESYQLQPAAPKEEAS